MVLLFHLFNTSLTAGNALISIDASQAGPAIHHRQDRRGQGFSYFGDENWSDYTLKLKGCKLSGAEGFMIVFGHKPGERYWWNLGGWGKRQYAIELNQSPVGRPVRGQIETKRWYDVKVELAGRRVRCYLDGELIHDASAPNPQKSFAIAGRDTKSGDLIVKAIKDVPAMLGLRGAERKSPDVQLTALRSAALTNNNSLDQPATVVPVESTINQPGATLGHEFPPYSLTIQRLITRRPAG